MDKNLDLQALLGEKQIMLDSLVNGVILLGAATLALGEKERREINPLVDNWIEEVRYLVDRG